MPSKGFSTIHVGREVGHYSRKGAAGLSDDKYSIDKVTKIKDGLWAVRHPHPIRQE